MELFQGLDQGSPTSLKLRATSCVPINAKDNYIDTHIWNETFAQFTFNKNFAQFKIILVLIFVNCEDTDHGNVIFRTGPAGNLHGSCGERVPAGTTLVAPGLNITFSLIP